MKLLIDKFEKLLNESSNVAIVGHHNPDGDSVGSVTALSHFLTQLGVNSTIFLPDKYPFYLDFLNEDNIVNIYSKDDLSSFDTIVCIDLNSLSRTDTMADSLYASSAKKILIDHHLCPKSEEFDLTISFANYSSACEILFWIIMGHSTIGGNPFKIPKQVLISLATGLITDTNNFSNSLFPSTFKMASVLVERGVDLQQLNRNVFSCYTVDRMRLMGELLSEALFVDEDSNAAYILLSLDLQEKFNFRPGDSEGFVNLPLQIKGIEVSALFTERSDMVRVSLRSVGDFSVNELSREFFNGGGHKNASGGKLFIPFCEVSEYFEKSIRNYINRHKICKNV